jgi:hypothetical protein
VQLTSNLLGPSVHDLGTAAQPGSPSLKPAHADHRGSRPDRRHLEFAASDRRGSSPGGRRYPGATVADRSARSRQHGNSDIESQRHRKTAESPDRSVWGERQQRSSRRGGDDDASETASVDTADSPGLSRTHSGTSLGISERSTYQASGRRASDSRVASPVWRGMSRSGSVASFVPLDQGPVPLLSPLSIGIAAAEPGHSELADRSRLLVAYLSEQAKRYGTVLVGLRILF